GLGARPVGLTGLDGGLLHAREADADLGYVGEVTDVRTGVLDALLDAGYLPIVAPLAGGGQSAAGEAVVYNVNADAAAGAIAAALGARAAVFLTDVPGVRDAAGAILPHASAASIQEMIESSVITGGMIPKVRACLDAL